MPVWQDLYSRRFESFLGRIRDSRPDYIVPVVRKAAKLIGAFGGRGILPTDKVRYREFFDWFPVDLEGKDIAIIDDAMDSGATLSEHRSFFEERGASVSTFAFVGLTDRARGSRRNYSPEAFVEIPTSRGGLKSYMWQEVEFINAERQSSDVHHIVLEGDAPHPLENYLPLLEALSREGFAYPVDLSESGPRGITVVEPRSYLVTSELRGGSDFFDGIHKIRFYLSERTISIAPVAFPRLMRSESCPLLEIATPFAVPCQLVGNATKHDPKVCYLSVSWILGAELLRTLKSTFRYPMLDEAWHNLSVRSEHLTHFLGPGPASAIASGISRFVSDSQGAGITPALVSALQMNLIWRGQQYSTDSLSLDGFQKLYRHLKSGYRARVATSGSELGASFYEPLDALLSVSGLPYLTIMETLDLDCDTGVLVPEVEARDEIIERVWRTGETDQELPWARTIRLIPWAITVIGEVAEERRGGTDPARKTAQATALNKTLANFALDYPKKRHFHDDFHCFVRSRYLHGTFVEVQDPDFCPSPRPIYDTRDLGGLYEYEGDQEERGVFTAKDGALSDLDEYFADSGEGSVGEIVNYLEFWASVAASAELGGASALDSFSMLRDYPTFLDHVKKNCSIWVEKTRTVVDVLHTFRSLQGGDLPTDLGEIELLLQTASTSISAALRKVDHWEAFPALIEKVDARYANSGRFGRVWNRIASTIDYDHLHRPGDFRSAEARRLLEPLQAACAYAAIMLTGHAPGGRSKDEVLEWAKALLWPQLTEDARLRWQKNDVTSLRQFLGELHQKLTCAVNDFPWPETSEDQRIEERGKAIKSQNIAVERTLRNQWYAEVDRPTIVFADLTGFRGENAPMLDQFYEIVDTALRQRSGVCLTPAPRGDDSLSYLFRDSLPAMRACCSLQRKAIDCHVPIKIGVASTALTRETCRDRIVETWGLAKDLATFKGPTFRNEQDILISETLRSELELRLGSHPGVFDIVPGGSIRPNPAAPDERVIRVDWRLFPSSRPF